MVQGWEETSVWFLFWLLGSLQGQFWLQGGWRSSDNQRRALKTML